MGRKKRGGSCCAAVVALGVSMHMVAAPDSQAGQRSRGVGVIAEQQMNGVDVELRVETLSGRTLHGGGLRSSDILRIGDRVQICFQVSQPGYISLWSQDGDAQAQQIFPNQYSPGGGRVDATEQCLGNQGDGFAFEVEGPVGDSLVFLHYSGDEAEQIGQEDYPVIRHIQSRAPASYASSTISFRIVD